MFRYCPLIIVSFTDSAIEDILVILILRLKIPYPLMREHHVHTRSQSRSHSPEHGHVLVVRAMNTNEVPMAFMSRHDFRRVYNLFSGCRC